MDECPAADNPGCRHPDQARRRAPVTLWHGRHCVVLIIVAWAVFVMAMLVLTTPGAGR